MYARPLIEPCPKCGEFPKEAVLDKGVWNVTCPKCGFTSPKDDIGESASTMQYAWIFWNSISLEYRYMPQLKPCPFCGETPCRVIEVADDFFVVECECEARGRRGRSIPEAVERWNKRKHSTSHKQLPSWAASQFATIVQSRIPKTAHDTQSDKETDQ